MPMSVTDQPCLARKVCPVNRVCQATSIGRLALQRGPRNSIGRHLSLVKLNMLNFYVAEAKHIASHWVFLGVDNYGITVVCTTGRGYRN